MMPRTRLDIKFDIHHQKALIENAKLALHNLYIEDALLCDDKQWYTEEEVEFTISKRPKKTVTHLMGIIHWNETFKDGDKPDDKVVIKRHKYVRQNGEWL